MSVVLNESELRFLLESHVGPVGQHVERKAKAVAERAKFFANAGGPGGRPRVRTGSLLRQLDAYGPHPDPGGPYWEVGSTAVNNNVAYPRLIELGGQAYSRRQGGFVSYRYPYLEPALPPDFVRGG